MISFYRGDIWEWLSQAPVGPEHSAWVMVPVNMLGIMGAGLAKQALSRYPKQCGDDIGARRYMAGWGYDDPQYVYTRWNPPLIFLPTKRRPQEPADYGLIERSLRHFAREAVLELGAWPGVQVAVAMPHIGCGLGRLDWKIVQPLVEDAVKQIAVPDVDVRFNLVIVEK